MSKNKLPVLYGDGEHDDADALQAWLNNKPVVYRNGEAVGNRISGLKFKMSRGIQDKGLRTEPSIIERCEFHNDDE